MTTIPRGNLRRAHLDVPLWQVIVSAVACAAGTVWMARMAVRIYPNSILKTGARIKLGQAIRESLSSA